MRYKIILLILFLISFTRLFSQSNDTDIIACSLKGNIKKIIWTNYNSKNVDSNFIKTSVIDYVVDLYDLFGNNIRSEYRGKDFKIDWVYFKEYNDSNRLIKNGEYDENNQIVWFSNRKYINSKEYIDTEFKKDSSLQAIYKVKLLSHCLIAEEKTYNSDTTLNTTYIYQYDDHNRIKTAKYINHLDENFTLTIYTYPDSLSTISTYYKNDSVNFLWRIEEKYNNVRTDFRRTTYYENGETSMQRFLYKYDKFRNWTERIDLSNNTIMTRDIEYY